MSMKKIFKKNQVIITALAIMIDVAGYINYSDNHLGIDGVLQKASTDSTDETAQSAADTDGIVEEIESLDYDLTDETALTEENAKAQEDAQGDAQGDIQAEEETKETADASGQTEESTAAEGTT